MVFTPDPRHGSGFVQGMTHTFNDTLPSCASSTGSHHGYVSESTGSDFDPENEAIMSSLLIHRNFSKQLPELRDTAKKYGRWSGNRLPEFQINTSALGRAFPDFSQGCSSDDGIAIEVARGAKARQRTSSQETRPQYLNNVDSPAVTIGDFQILSTPPMNSQPKPPHQQDVSKGNSRKESQSKRSSVTQKENIPPPDKPVSDKRIPNYISGASRTINGEQRRTLTELHAQVADDSEGSFVGDERPAAVTLAAKAPRFVNFRPKKSPLVNANGQNRRIVNDAIVDALASRRSGAQEETPCRPSSNPTVTSTLNANDSSFLLPNMPDISELVSGSFKDGTPVFTGSGKVQTRFSSNGNGWKRTHKELDGITAPQEEKDIFLSLQLLQNKVDALETEKADNQRALEELQNHNYHLQAEKEELQRRHRSDSALGMADSGSDGEFARDNKKLVVEKTRSKAQLKSLQNLLETSDRNVSNLELRLKTNTGERDQAVKQLAEAWYSIEQLKVENDLLRRENESLKQQLNSGNVSLRKENEELRKLLLSGNEQLREEHETLKQQSKAQNDLLRQEADSFKEQLNQLASDRAEIQRNWQQKENSLKRKLQRREDALKEMQDVTREINVTKETKVHTSIVETKDVDLPQRVTGKRISSIGEFELPIQVKVQTREPLEQPTTLNIQKADRGRSSFIQLSSASQKQAEQRLKPQSRSRSRLASITEPIVSKKEKLRAMILDFDNDIQFDDTTEEGSFDDTTRTIHKDINVSRGYNDHDRTHGSNYSSILGHGEMERMREMLADAKAEQQERLANSAQALENETVRSIRSVRSAPGESQVAQRKSSENGLIGVLKSRDARDGDDDVTGHSSIKSGGHGATGQDQTVQSTTHQRRHSEPSVPGRTKSRHHIVVEETTSAFILPDITMHSNCHGTEHKTLSAGARKVLDNLAQHDGHNCTVCSRVASFETENASIKIDTRKTIRIEKPVPVSDRMPVAEPYEDEPTLRPSVSPGLALATVMKGLQDELAHFKMELAQCQSMYNKFDMSLGMRKRKAIKAKIESLLKAIDNKADQIYGLYDVLEGQKQSGQELSEEDIEITLQSIGVDVDAPKYNKTHGGKNHSTNRDGENDSETDLPWEGIEDTTGTSSMKERRRSWGL